MNPDSEIWQCQDLICNTRSTISVKTILRSALKQTKKKVTVQISFLVIINLGSIGYGQWDTRKQVILQLLTCLQV